MNSLTVLQLPSHEMIKNELRQQRITRMKNVLNHATEKKLECEHSMRALDNKAVDSFM